MDFSDRPFWFDRKVQARFRDERTARKGAQIPDIDRDPDDDFGDEPDLAVFDPWGLA